MTEGGVERSRARCFNANCDETFESVNEMVPVAGSDGQSPRHFCEGCAERVRRGPPLTDGGTDRSETPGLGDAYPEDYVHPKPLPPEHELDDAECHNCGEPWNGGEDWDERHLSGGPSIGEDWLYTCPGCGEETFEVGT